MRAKDAVGEYGERLAARHLVDDGMQILERRWRCREGEIDLLALDAGCLVVCEVKTRRSTATGSPAEAVTRVKLARLRRLAAAWLHQQDQPFPDVRIDVVAVLLRAAGAPAIEHLRAVG